MSKFTIITLLATTLLSLPAVAPAVPSVPGAPSSIPELSLQVWALRTLHELELTPLQLKAFRAAAEGASHATPRNKNKVPEKYVAALRTLRDALLRGDDDDRIAELRDDLESMREDDDVEVDDDITITAEARAKAPDLLRMLTASQVGGYIAAYQDEIPDPVATLMDAADDARGTDDDEFKSIVEETADDVSGLLIGLDVEKGKPVAEQVRAWMKRCQGLSDAEFKSKRAELESAAKSLVGDVGPFVILRHWLERDLAELLSNPQLIPAIDARLRQGM